MRFVIAFLLLAGCAHAKPIVRPKLKPPPVIEKVTETELLHYKAAFMTFKALEAAIMERYHVKAEDGEVFDPDTGVIVRPPKQKMKDASAPPPKLLPSTKVGN